MVRSAALSGGGGHGTWHGTRPLGWRVPSERSSPIPACSRIPAYRLGVRRSAECQEGDPSRPQPAAATGVPVGSESYFAAFGTPLVNCQSFQTSKS
jgi:hypothetical protein